ncbi:MAG: helicase C-terminal domain-containing protein [Fibrobacterota bacterium]
MLIKTDPESRKIELSVREISDCFAHSDPVSGFGSFRVRLGQEVHTRFRKKMETLEGYLPEYTVSYSTEFKDYSVSIQGRIDGVFKKGEKVYIQEIKSADLSGDCEYEEADPNHRMQCLIYAYFYQESTGMDVFPVLIMVDIFEDTVQEIPLEYNRGEIERFLQNRLRQLLEESLRKINKAEKKKEAASRIRFPFSEMRKNQQKMIDDISPVFSTGRHLLMSSPTGTGKTVVTLFPALKETLKKDAILFFVTPKNSQHSLALDSLRRLIPEGYGVYALQISGKEKICPEEYVFCSPHSCRLLKNTPGKSGLEKIATNLKLDTVVTTADIIRTAAEAGICPFELSLYLCEEASAVVCDYNYVFDPRVRIQRIFDGSRKDMFLIVDEAHNLPSRGRGYMSASLYRSKIKELTENPVLEQSGLFSGISRLLKEVKDYVETSTLPDEWAPAAEYRLFDPDDYFFEEMHLKAEELLMKYINLRHESNSGKKFFIPGIKAGTRRKTDPLIDFLFGLIHFCSVVEQRSEKVYSLASSSEDDTGIEQFCADPSDVLGECFSFFKSAVCISATLNPPSFYADLMGISGYDPLYLHYESPFPPENRLVLTVGDISTYYRERSAAAPLIADFIRKTFSSMRGNVFVFFPSFSFLRNVASFFKSSAEEIIIQPQGGSGKAADEILLRLKKGEGKTSKLLFAVQGGLFSEGVDFPGKLCEGVIVIGPGLPYPDFKTRLLCEHFESGYSCGREYAFIYPGITRVVQAAGRLIRSEKDKGFIIFLGRRFAEKPYCDLINDFWDSEAVASGDAPVLISEFMDKSN